MYFVILNYNNIMDDVININTTKKEMEVGQSIITASQCIVELNNINGKYDDDLPNSNFYSSNWYNKLLYIVDIKNKITVFSGKVKKYEANEKTAKIYATNFFKDLLDITCSYTRTNLTAPEHIYNIITNVAGLPSSIIDYGAYINALTIQQGQNIKININVPLEANYSCLDIIEVLCRMSGLELFENEEKLIMNSWQQYNGQQGIQLYDEHYIPGTFTQYYDDRLFFNQIVCAYSTGAAINYYTATDGASIFQYNVTKTQKLPDNNITSTNLSDYKIYYTNATSAQNAATLLLNKYSMPLKYCEFAISPELTTIKVNDILNLYFGNLQNEPVKVLKVDYKDEMISIKALYLNKPHVYYTPISEIVHPVEITSILRLDNTSILFTFTDVNENTSKYIIYFRPVDGDWHGTNSLQGLSPIEKNSDSIDTRYGEKYFILSGLKPLSSYQIKILAITNSGTKSDFSNKVTVFNTYFDTNYENKYYVKGTLATGIMLDVLNSNNGYLPNQINDDWVLYSSCYYGEKYYSPNAVYETPMMIAEKYFKYFSFNYYCPGQNNIKWQYRINGDTRWSMLHDKDEIVYFTCPNNTKSIQFRFIFYSVNWTDEVYIYLRKYSEV